MSGASSVRKSSRAKLSCRSAANDASGKPGCILAHAATTASASGKPAQALTMSSTASGSASIRSLPILRSRSCRASAPASKSMLSGRAPARVIRPINMLRLVTITRQPGAPGSNGLTWLVSLALSSTMSIRLPDSNDR
jgi:hypothetical protein